MIGCTKTKNNFHEEIAVFDTENNLLVCLGQQRDEVAIEGVLGLESDCINLDFNDNRVSAITVVPNSIDCLSITTYNGAKLGLDRQMLIELYGQPNSIVDLHGNDNLVYHYTVSDGRCIRVDAKGHNEENMTVEFSVQFLLSDENLVVCISIIDMLFQK